VTKVNSGESMSQCNTHNQLSEEKDYHRHIGLMSVVSQFITEYQTDF